MKKLIPKHQQGARLRYIDQSGTTWGNRGQGNELQSALENGLSWPINKAIDIGNFIGQKLMQLVKSDTESPKPEYYTRKKPNDSKTTQEKSQNLENWVAKQIRNETRKKELSDAYFIPYIDEKEIKIPGFGRVSENVLDSIYVNAQRAGIPFKDALGLAAYETHLGAIPLFSVDSQKKAFKKKHGYNMPAERVKELENVSLNASVARNFGGIPAQYLINNYDWAKNGWATSPKYKHLKNISSPLEHGFTLYKMGLYNTNAKKHKSEIRDWGNTLLQTKPVKTFLQKKQDKKTNKK